MAELDRLRERGARIALDDTGTGYSGLRQIAELRPDVGKLDRAFVDGLDTDQVKAVFAEFLTGVASRLDAQLLAEGVEGVPELDRLIAMGVPLAQGWLLGRPDTPRDHPPCTWRWTPGAGRSPWSWSIPPVPPPGPAGRPRRSGRSACAPGSTPRWRSWPCQAESQTPAGGATPILTVRRAGRGRGPARRRSG